MARRTGRPSKHIAAREGIGATSSARSHIGRARARTRAARRTYRATVKAALLASPHYQQAKAGPERMVMDATVWAIEQRIPLPLCGFGVDYDEDGADGPR
jgi:hypothetical protein